MQKINKESVLNNFKKHKTFANQISCWFSSIKSLETDKEIIQVKSTIQVSTFYYDSFKFQTI